MTDEQALLAAIIANPAEDTPRLAYADWLDEQAGTVECGRCFGTGSHLVHDAHLRFGTRFSERVRDDAQCTICSGTGRVSDGRAARAEFIRVQVELARWDPGQGKTWNAKRAVKFRALRRRERALLEQSWAGNLDLGFGGGPWTDLVWSRGFVSALVCTWNAWRTHAAAILAAQPIERVRLTTPPTWAGVWKRHADGTQTTTWPDWPRITFELPAEREPPRLDALADAVRGIGG